MKNLLLAVTILTFATSTNAQVVLLPLAAFTQGVTNLLPNDLPVREVDPNRQGPLAPGECFRPCAQEASAKEAAVAFNAAETTGECGSSANPCELPEITVTAKKEKGLGGAFVVATKNGGEQLIGGDTALAAEVAEWRRSQTPGNAADRGRQPIPSLGRNAPGDARGLEVGLSFGQSLFGGPGECAELLAGFDEGDQAPTTHVRWTFADVDSANGGIDQLRRDAGGALGRARAALQTGFPGRQAIDDSDNLSAPCGSGGDVTRGMCVR